jgi:hypothetical protein
MSFWRIDFMKISIGKVNAGKAILTFELDGKTYTQTWHEDDKSGLVSVSMPILEQLENEKVEYETDLFDLFESLEVEVASFLKLCSVY